MTPEEANKIIAEYMCYRLREGYSDRWCNEKGSCGEPDFISLDALVPVWEKLKENGVWLNKLGNRNYNQFCLFADKPTETYTPFSPFDFFEHIGETIQEAAAIATAKAIKELKC